jgi:hypothetical protein
MMAAGRTQREAEAAREQAALCRRLAATVSSRDAAETLLAEAHRLDTEAERMRPLVPDARSPGRIVSR